jgi:hypothetical protein
MTKQQTITARGAVTVRLDQIFGTAPKQPPAQQDTTKETTNGPHS